jgi:RHS repeat-associated protein
LFRIGLAPGQYTNLSFTSMPETLIGAISEASDLAPVYPSPPAQSGTYNDLNQLTDLSGQALSWDADGNLLSDGTRDYAWDAENRLVTITYPGAPGKETDFSYDGFGRRTAITSIPAGGGEGVTTSYLWCGTRLCQARDASGATTREYYAEGEYLPGPPAQPYYYGIDQLGSVRRVFVSTTSAPGYAYDPYGNPLQGAPPTDFGYAGMFHNADSGLDLTLYRAYDPTVGRWLSRDPLGEQSDPVGNLYPYVRNNPISATDLSGRYPICPTPNPVQEPGNSNLSTASVQAGSATDNPEPTVLRGTTDSAPPDPSQEIGNAPVQLAGSMADTMNRRGISPAEVMHAVASPSSTTEQENGNTLIIGINGIAVVLGPNGEYVTTWRIGQ